MTDLSPLAQRLLYAANRAYLWDAHHELADTEAWGWRQADSLIDEKYPLARDTSNELVELGLLERDFDNERWWYRLTASGRALADSRQPSATGDEKTTALGEGD